MKFRDGDKARYAAALILDALEDLAAAVADSKDASEAAVCRALCSTACISAIGVLDLALTDSISERGDEDVNRMASIISGTTGWEVFPLSDGESFLSLNKAGRIRAMPGSEASVARAVKRIGDDVYDD